MTADGADVAATPGDAGDCAAAGAEIRLVPVGELDIATAPTFLGSLAEAVDRRPSSVEIDLRWLTFIDASSVGAIAAASSRMGTWGGTLAACQADRVIQRTFALCGLAHLLVGDAPETDAAHPRTPLPTSLRV